ncbi:MAG: hypothetical protein WCO11_12330 [Sphingomonadales bacterium]|jgi:hypothetical protein
MRAILPNPPEPPPELPPEMPPEIPPEPPYPDGTPVPFGDPLPPMPRARRDARVESRCLDLTEAGKAT